MENLNKRLADYEEDFLFSKGIYYSAAERIKRTNICRKTKDKWLTWISIILSVTSVSGLIYILGNDENQKLIIMIVGGLSLIAIFVNIYQAIYHENENENEYFIKAERYNDQFKKIKNLRALFLDNLIKEEELKNKFEEICQTDEKLRSQVLHITEKDKEKCNEKIERGDYKFKTELNG